MRIIEGSASGRSVSLHSDEFMVTATFHEKDGTITTETKRRNRLNKFVLRHPYLPPRTLAFALRILSEFSVKQYLLFSMLFVLLVMALSVLMAYLGMDASPESQEKMNGYAHAGKPILLLVSLLVYRKHIAGFHAAEHMANSAYQQFGTAGVEKIAEGTRINLTCRSRFLVPATLMSLVTYTGIMLIGEQVVIFSSLLWEGVLWLDTTIGIQNITPLAKATELVQQFVTTKPPTETELRTGQEALRQLLIAHGELE